MAERNNINWSAFIKAGGFDALKACTSDIVVTSRRIGNDPHEDIFVDIFFNFMDAYTGVSFGEIDVMAPSTQEAVLNFLSNAACQNEWGGSHDSVEGFTPMSSRAEQDNSVAIIPLPDEDDSNPPAPTTTPDSIEDLDEIQPNEGGDTHSSGRENGFKLHESSSSEIDTFIAPALQKMGTTEESSTGTVEGELMIWCPVGKDQQLTSMSEARGTEAEPVDLQRSTKPQDHLRDHEWISRTEAINVLIKRHSRVYPDGTGPADVIALSAAVPLIDVSSGSSPNRREPKLEGLNNTGKAKLIAFEGQDRSCPRGDPLEYDSDCEDRIEPQKPIRTQLENADVGKRPGKTLERGPRAFSMDSFESGAEETSLKSGTDSNVDKGTADMEIVPSEILKTISSEGKGIQLHGERLDDFEPPIDPLREAIDTGDGLKIGCALLRRASSRALKKLRRSLSLEKSDSERGEDESDTEWIDSDGEDNDDNRVNGVADEKNNSQGTQPAQIKKGAARKPSIRRALMAVGRTFSRNKSANRTVANEADAPKEAQEGRNLSRLETLQEDPYASVDWGDKDGSLSGRRNVETLGNREADVQGNETVTDVIEKNVGQTAGATDDSKNTSQDADMKKLTHKLSIRKAAGMLRKLGSKDKPSRNATDKRPEDKGGSGEEAPNNEERVKRPNFIKRLLSRSKSRDVAGNQS